MLHEPHMGMRACHPALPGTQRHQYQMFKAILWLHTECEASLAVDTHPLTSILKGHQELDASLGGARVGFWDSVSTKSYVRTCILQASLPEI